MIVSVINRIVKKLALKSSFLKSFNVHTTNIIFLCIVSYSLTGQTTWIVEPIPNVKKLKRIGDFFLVDDGNTVRILDTLGAQVYYPKDSILPLNLTVASGETFVLVKKDKFYGLQTIEGKPILPTVYDEINPISKHFFKVKKYDSYAVVNDQNQLILPYQKPISPKAKTDSIIHIQTSQVNQYYNANGDTVDLVHIKDITSKYKTDGFIYTRNSENLWGIIHNEKDTLIPLKYDWITQVTSDQFLVKKGPFYGVITKDEIIVPFDYSKYNFVTLAEKQILNFSNKYNNRCLLYFPESKKLFGEEAESISIKGENSIDIIPNIKKRNERNIYTPDLKHIITIDDKFEYLSDNLIVKYEDSTSIVINYATGNKVFEADGIIIRSALGALYLKKNGLYGLVSKTGETISLPKYKTVSQYQGVYKFETLDKKIVHYNNDGVIIPYESSRIDRIGCTPFYNTGQNIINDKGDIVFDQYIKSATPLNCDNKYLLKVQIESGTGILRVDR